MIQLTVVTTLFGAASAAAAIDAGLLGSPDERVLVVANNAPVPEVVPPFSDTPGAGAVLSRFDRVVDLGALLSPQRPAQWTVKGLETPAQERLLRSHWDLGSERLELVLESVHVPPAATIAAVLVSARVTVLSEGLMSYGPTRDPQSHHFGQRINGLVYLDLVEGLRPLLLSEHGVTSQPIPPDAFRAVVEEMAASAGLERVVATEPTALVLGQYLAALRLVTAAEESAMQVAMVKAASELGARRVLFKPHPSAPATDAQALTDVAKSHDLDFEIVDSRLSAEAIMATRDLVGVVAGFSTALTTATRVFGLETRAVGTERMFGHLKPYENSNRIPLTVVDYLRDHGGDESVADDLTALTRAVAFTMQPETLASLRSEATAYLEGCPPERRRRYFDQGRINALGLPGAKVPGALRRFARTALERVPPGISRPLYRGLNATRARLARRRRR